MRAIYFPVTVFILLTGCASPFVLMVNPKTSQSVECSGVGRGLVSAIAVSNHVDNCVKQYEGLGYVRADNLTTEQRATINAAPPTAQHRVEPPAVVTVPAQPAQNRSFNCTSNRIGDSTYTNCY
jgi:hypothetical protein